MLIFLLIPVLLWAGSVLDYTATGGTLPTGFTGTYGTNMMPNTNYFSISSGDALNNGATLGSPYDGNINTSGRANPNLRPEGKYDIGAYEFITGSIAIGTGTTTFNIGGGTTTISW
jgi:hypothetical protein